MKSYTGCFLFLLLNIQGLGCFAQIRQEVSLNGTWDFKWDNENRLAYPPDDKGWTTIEVTRKSRSRQVLEKTAQITGHGTEEMSGYRMP